ncbi:MAG: hypothetical protein Q4C87_06770 [Actinomycetaceae bacterium]|nr:hypothetical protein [Actinomycetaceae bacterium]
MFLNLLWRPPSSPEIPPDTIYLGFVLLSDVPSFAEVCASMKEEECRATHVERTDKGLIARIDDSLVTVTFHNEPFPDGEAEAHVDAGRYPDGLPGEHRAHARIVARTDPKTTIHRSCLRECQFHRAIAWMEMTYCLSALPEAIGVYNPQSEETISAAEFHWLVDEDQDSLAPALISMSVEHSLLGTNIRTRGFRSLGHVELEILHSQRTDEDIRRVISMIAHSVFTGGVIPHSQMPSKIGGYDIFAHYTRSLRSWWQWVTRIEV